MPLPRLPTWSDLPFLKKKKRPPHKIYTRLTETVIQASESEASAVLSRMGSRMDGLTRHEAAARLRQYGENKPVHSVKKHKLQRLLEAYQNPLNLLLTILAAISFLTEDVASGAIIVLMMAVAVGIRFFQEVRADESAERLKAMVRTTATVIRDGARREIPLAHVVRGDVILLSAGDLVPADVRLIESKDLFVNQSALTGESIAAEKHARMNGKAVGSPFELPNICFMGTNVESGSALAVVVLTGTDTYFGAISQRITSVQSDTEFDKGMKGFTWLMIRFMMVMVPLVFVINAFTKHDLLEAFLFALAVAVGLTPEMLPMIVTVNLANGAMTMSRKKVIVKKLSSIQNFGAINVLCTDKTGTLTHGRVILEKHINVRGQDDLDVLLYAYVNSHYQTGLKNIMDLSVVEHGKEEKLDSRLHAYHKVDEIPWDFKRRRMSVVADEHNRRRLLICKGAVEEILKISPRMELGGRTFRPGRKDLASMRALVQSLNEDGFRVIAIAYKELSASRSTFSVSDEEDLTLMGFIAFLDPPKESARKAVAGLASQGVEIKVLTGDNDLVTNKIAHDIGLPVKGILMGSDIDAMDDLALQQAVETSTIFAKLSPIHKERIIRALQRNQHVVGFLGDGINDAPALKAADVGISVDSAVDVAKESSDIILLEKSLLVLEEGIIEGRKVFGNIIKYARMAASSNFGNMFSVLGASLLLPFLPMAPLQILVNNLLYDLSQTAIPSDNVDKEWLSKPRKWNLGRIQNFIIFIGPISSIFDYTTYAMMWFVFGATTVASAALFQTGWFVESLLTQALIIHVIRTNKIPFIESRASTPLLLASLLVSAVGIWLTVSPFASALGFVPLPPLYWPLLLLTLVCYVALTQKVKTWYLRRYEKEDFPPKPQPPVGAPAPPAPLAPAAPNPATPALSLPKPA
ncbi:Copper-exporting P-type ATPase B [uncultured archaeon]|nr:Copper-exporting P-type ATPase B [uncultured archaeon]